VQGPAAVILPRSTAPKNAVEAAVEQLSRASQLLIQSDKEEEHLAGKGVIESVR
jgi:hypothetical protein